MGTPVSPFDGLASPTWMTSAACAAVGSEPFFASYQGASARTGKAVCSGCSVIDACYAYALEDASLTGIWGGTTMRERVNARREVAA